MAARVTDAPHAELVGERADLVLPRVGRDVEAVVHDGAAEGEQAVAQAVAGGPLRLGDAEGDQVPVPVPAPAGEVLGVGEADALEERAWARVPASVGR